MFPIEARFTGKGGWRTQAETAAEHLTPGEVYTVLRMDVGRSGSHLVLADFPDLQFNTVMFDAVARDYADDEDCEPEPPEHGQRLRAGRSLGRTLYLDTGDDWEAHECIGMVDTPELAAWIVSAVNAAAGEESR